jgi:hypothetical protein
MPRYIVERRFANRLKVPGNGECASAVGDDVDKVVDLGVTWIHSYISDDRQTTFCVCDGPDPASIREATRRCGFHCDQITEVGALVSCLDRR